MNDSTVVIDSSIMVAILKSESDAQHLFKRIISYKRRIISAPTWLESAIVCESALKQSGGADRFERMIAQLGIEIVPFSAEQAQLAFEAFKRFGKGRGAKAALNYGDCFVYALAKELGAPLLFKGGDFAQTDILAA